MGRFDETELSHHAFKRTKSSPGSLSAPDGNTGMISPAPGAAAGGAGARCPGQLPPQANHACKCLKTGPRNETFSPKPASKSLSLVAGVRYDHIKFEIDDKFLANGDQSETLKFDEINYSLGAAYSPVDEMSIYVNHSTAFETHTFTEFANPSSNGSLGGFANVAAQRTEGYELGIKGFLFDRLRYEIAYYDMSVEDEVTTVSNVGGRAFFNNADTERDGIEFGFDLSIVTGLDILGAYTYSELEFERFVNVPDAVGSNVPGVPKHHGYIELDYHHSSGMFFKWDWTYVGSIFADNLNQTKASNYNLSNLVIGTTKKFNRFTVSPRFGVNNLFKQDYNQEIRIQDATSRFFEPAPGRNIYGALQMNYQFSD